jgi:hypothetical protein
MIAHGNNFYKFGLLEGVLGGFENYHSLLLWPEPAEIHKF